MDDFQIPELSAKAVRMEIENYSREHPNDFGIPDGKDRIPMKKLMKLFEIKKKTAPEKQNLFRQLVNEHCELEIKEGIGKVLVLKDCDGYDDESSESTYDGDEVDYGYGEAAPSATQDTCVDLKTESDDDTKGRGSRFRPPSHSSSGGLSVATAESVGLYDPNNNQRRTGYRRRGSVTRYSIIGQEQVVGEYKKHEEVINQFRQDSKTISRSIRNLQVNQEPEEESPEMPSSSEDYDNSPKRLTPSPVVKKKNKMKGGGIRRFIRQTRFSLAF